MLHTSRVLVVGSISVDVTASVRRLPAPGETLRGSGLAIGLGGKGANQAVAAARAGAESSFIGCIGADHFADVAHDALVAAGVHTDKLMAVPGPTGVAHIRVDEQTGENDIVIVPLANDQLTPARVRTQLADLSQHDVVLTQLETSLGVVQEAASATERTGARLVLDPAPAAEVPEDLWPMVHITTPNETEASSLTGVTVSDVPSATAALDWFVQRGVRHPIITLAAQGLVWWDGAQARHLPVIEVSVRDTTAAGDAFTGALAAQLAAGESMPDAVEFAAAAGALAVTSVGASASLPSRADIEKLLAGG